MKEETIKVPLLTRLLDTGDIEIRKETGKPTKIRFSGTSTYRVERFFGGEVLDHSPNAIKLERAKLRAIPLLFNHDMDDPIGMVDDVRIEGDRTMVDAHFFDTDRAREVEAMMEGGLRNVSSKYRVLRVEEQPKTNTSYVREWEPVEYSIVTVPSDPTVGQGRAASGEQEFEVRILRASPPAGTADPKEQSRMDDEKKGTAAPTAEPAAAPEKQLEAARAAIDSRSAVDLEQGRVRAIANLAKANKIPENIQDTWVRHGYSLEQVSNDILNILEQRGKSNPQPASRLGLTGAETQRFSLVRAINAAASRNWKDAGFELECSRGVAQKTGKVADDNKFYVPFEVMERPVMAMRDFAARLGQRDLTVATAGAGGYLVETENVGFIEMLRNRSVCFRMGARRLSGLVGSVTIPRQSAAATAVWLANEASTATESAQTFVQVALTPKNVGAYTEISRQLLLQSSPGVEGIVSDDLAQVVAIAADLAGLEGSGAGGQPTGISATAGIGAVTGTSLAAAGIIEFQTDVAASNVMPQRGGYVSTPAVAGLLMTERLWKGNIFDGSMFNFPAMTSNQLTAATMIFGDWQELIIAEWGVLEVEVNPYAGFQAGIVGVRALYSLDVGVRRPFAFSRATSIT
jgi:HK97 family phage major capsid protein